MQINNEAETEVVTKKLRMTQQDWITHFNKKGEKMVSAADLYSLAKEDNKELLKSIQKDFEYYVVTSTRINYIKDSLDAEIIHDFGSTVAKPKATNVKIPIFEGDFEENSETEMYLQALFDTQDSLQDIQKNLEVLSNNGKLRLWTPDQGMRNRRQERAVWLCFFGDGRFNVDGDNWIDGDDGLSRGVKSLVPSAKQTAKKGRKPQ